MGQILAEKIVARAPSQDKVGPREVLTCRVDLAIMHDSRGQRRVKPVLGRLDVKVWDPARIVVVSDHYVPVFDAESAAILAPIREWVAAKGIEHLDDMRGNSTMWCRPSGGYLKPGMFEKPPAARRGSA